MRQGLPPNALFNVGGEQERYGNKADPKAPAGTTDSQQAGLLATRRRCRSSNAYVALVPKGAPTVSRGQSEHPQASQPNIHSASVRAKAEASTLPKARSDAAIPTERPRGAQPVHAAKRPLLWGPPEARLALRRQLARD
jgi:hypothetical protein